MEKSKVPTSSYEVLCDYFDTSLNAQFHITDEGEQKLIIFLGDVEDEEPAQISLYREDVEILANVLKAMAQGVERRNILKDSVIRVKQL